MLFNEKQLKILQQASQVLIQELGMKNEDAMKLIADGISVELSTRKTNMETVVKSHRTVQIAFIQDVARTITRKISNEKKHPPAKIAQAMEKFRGILDSIWSFE